MFLCPLMMRKLSIKQHKRTFVNCSKTQYFQAFQYIPTSHEKCAEIFNSCTIHFFMSIDINLTSLSVFPPFFHA